jgi:phosphoribosylformylglycinamidine synthase
MAGGLGADIDLAVIDHTTFPAGYDVDATLLFSESCTRFLVEVEPGKKFNFQTKLMGVPCIPLGRLSGGTRVKVKGVDGRSVIDVSIAEAHAAFHGGFQG